MKTPWSSRWLTGCLAFAVLAISPSIVQAQGKYWGVFGSFKGSISGGGRTMLGETGSTAALGRQSSARFDVVPGVIGVFASDATIQLTTQPGEFSLLGVPVKPANPAFGALFEELGSPDITKWRLGHWSPADSSYQEAAAGNLGPIAVGEGLWLITPDTRTVSIKGLPAPTTTFDIPLVAGPGGRPAWNQIANPFLFPIDVTNVVVTDGATAFRLTDAGNTHTERVAKVWDPAADAYVDATVINGRGGFWVKRIVSGTVRVLIRPVASASGTPAPSFELPPSAAWAVSLAARQNGRASEPLVVGVADVRPGVWNSLCASQTPLPPGRSLGIYVPRRDWGALSDRYVRDFRAPSEPREWDVVLVSGAAPGEVALEATAFDLPAGVRLVIEDPREGWSREIVPGAAALTLPATSGERRLRLRAVADGSIGITPSRDGLLHVYPSPFASTAGIALSLARGGDLVVDVYDAQGRHVRSIQRPGANPGEHVLVWDGRDAAGRAAAPGVYLARWTAGTTGGTARLVKVE